MLLKNVSGNLDEKKLNKSAKRDKYTLLRNIYTTSGKWKLIHFLQKVIKSEGVYIRDITPRKMSNTHKTPNIVKKNLDKLKNRTETKRINMYKVNNRKANLKEQKDLHPKVVL